MAHNDKTSKDDDLYGHTEAKTREKGGPEQLMGQRVTKMTERVDRQIRKQI